MQRASQRRASAVTCTPPARAPPAAYDPVTRDVDTASVSADGSVYTNPKHMVVIVSGASGDIEGDDRYTPGSPSFTGTENYVRRACT